VALGLLVVAAVPAAAAKPQTTVKSYTALGPSAPVPLAPGSGATITFSNARASSQAFASAQLTVPAAAGLSATTASVPAPWRVTDVTPSAALPSDPRVLLLTNTSPTSAGVAPGSSLDVTLYTTAASAGGTYTIPTRVKQSNDFSGTGNDFVLSGAQPVVQLGRPAVALSWATQPSTVQVSPGTSSPGATPVLVMCSAPSVRAVDDQGNTVTSFTGTVALAPESGDGGLRLQGSTTLTATAVAGVATFGTCTSGLTATTLGFGDTLRASSGSLTPDVSEAFDVRQFYADCAASCTTPKLVGAGGTSVQVQADGSTTSSRLTFDVGQGGWEHGSACNPDVGAPTLNPYRDAVTVLVDHRTKTATLTWTKTAVQWSTNNGASQWGVCLAAAQPFYPVAGAPGTYGSVQDPPGSGLWVGLLRPCGGSGVAPLDPCLAKLNKSNGGQQQAVVRIPDQPGDPRMY
jgi:hypothetical protein